MDGQLTRQRVSRVLTMAAMAIALAAVAPAMTFAAGAQVLQRADGPTPRVPATAPTPRTPLRKTAIDAPRPAPADLTSREHFDAWLARHAKTPTPLDALSPGGRERLVDSIDFGPGGIGGLGTADLANELTQAQIDAVLVWLSVDAGMARSRIDAAAADAVSAGARVARPNTAITPIERRVNAFLRDVDRGASDATPAAHNARVATLYDAAFHMLPSNGEPAKVSDADLSLLQRAARQAAHAGYARAVDAMQALLPMLQARGIATTDDLQDVQNALLTARRFDAARALHDANPHAELDAIPALRDAVTATPTAPTAWRLRDGGALLERERIALAGTRIVVTAGCHFSQDAAADIAKDPVLGTAFARHATWLMAAPGGESIDAVLDWNRRFPQAQALMRHDDDEWSLLPSFAMPTFYVIRDGRVIERVTGWSSRTKEQRQPLIDALSRSGLLAD